MIELDEMYGDVLTSALSYAGQGWHIFPIHSRKEDGSCTCGEHCTNPGKHPLTRHGVKDATVDPERIRSWWKQYPFASVAVATGPESNLWVLDVDGEEGAENLAELEDEHGNLPTTPWVKTASGGQHFYFRYPKTGGQRNSASLVAHRIDVRADGGYIIMPPSWDGAYYWEEKPPKVAAAPRWLLERNRRQELQVIQGGAGTEPYSEGLRNWALSALRQESARLSGIAEGSRNDALNRSAFRMGQIGAHSECLAVEEVWEALSAACDENGLIPDDGEAEARATFKQGWESGLKSPRTKMPKFDADPDDHALPLFDKGGPLIANIAKVVESQGPLAWGLDGAFWTYEDGVWKSDPDAVMRRVTKLLGNKYRRAHASNVADVIQHGAPEIACEPLHDYINFRNGMLNWKTGEIVPHDPSFMSTVQVGTEWDPRAECPRFDAFLHEILEPDFIEMAWEMIGYLMYSGNPLQIAFMFLGEGRNGKGTLMRVLSELLGTENISSEKLDSLNGNRFAAVSLFGKIANMAGDIDATYQESTANFKKLTGEDFYYAERKYGDRFGFTSWAVPVFSANKIPGSTDTSQGYLRRWVIFKFPHDFSKAPVQGLSGQLVAELPGIAARAVPALRTLMERGAFDIKGEAAQAKEDFATSIDQVRQWIEDEAEDEWGAVTPRSDLYNDYRDWADRNGMGRLKSSEFFARLASNGYGQKKVRGIRIFEGIKLRPSQSFFDH